MVPLQLGFGAYDHPLVIVISVIWGPLSLVSTTEELLGRKRSGSGIESREYCCRDPSR
jgi:hypothetical protein